MKKLKSYISRLPMAALFKNNKYIISYLFAITVFVIVGKICFFEVYLVDGVSMENTLFGGDKVFILKKQKPSKNSVVIFNTNELTLIKRCVGFPGDVIKIVNGVVSINNNMVGYPQTILTAPAYIADPSDLIQSNAPNDFDIRICAFYGNQWTKNNFGPFKIPYKGECIKINLKNYLIYKELILQDSKANIDTNTQKAYVFKNNYFFALGDNRSKSDDSRVLGPIAESNIIGEAHYILFSETNFKFSRLFKKIY